MSATQETQQNTKLTYRRFKDGDNQWKRSQENLFKSSWTYKCPTYIQSTPPCQGKCPAGEDVRGWLNIVRGIEKAPLGADGKPSMPWQEYAWRRLTECNPFPAIMGRVCPAPCQTGCNRAQVDDVVGINSVEQFLGNYAIENGLSFPKPEKESGKKVAIVGGGVAGLSAAYQLRRKGHACTIFETYGKLGGMLAFGLPDYRTTQDVVQAEIKRITDMGGIDVRFNTRVGKDVSMDDLRKQFDAVFVAIGAQGGMKLDIPGSDASNCIDALHMLRAYNEKKLTDVGANVVIIGGGNTAMDAAAVARRVGSNGKTPANVVIAYRRTVAEMPADQHEKDAVVAAGVVMTPCVIPVSVVKGADGKATALRVAKVEWVNKKMQVIEGSEYDIPANLIVSAVGQFIQWEGMENLKNAKDKANVDKTLQAMGQAGVFVGGDAITPDLLTTAIGHARIAAGGIDDYLTTGAPGKRPAVDKSLFNLQNDLAKRGAKFETLPEGYTRATCDNKNAVHNFDDRADRQIIKHDELFLGHFTYTARSQRAFRPVDADHVLGDHAEHAWEPLTEAQAVTEAKRCMSCGLCFECDNCVIYCPQGAVKRVPKKEASIGRYVTTDYFKCIGCHICKDVCPTGYIQMGLGGEGN
ncbi:MAG: NAD(P)-binding protein [Candidatus Nitricoxidivorans perseverans]|uniref:NAD(P)-binding protein n=1 Tax=Candidatus Nitricoxidivorans perseverans TaxID=2975601 RepID=A0AA49FM32_9PROT|nr:MAG: NAD(P)-binding protein [Candidatus Nitricoxidivorans perseverans]